MPEALNLENFGKNLPEDLRKKLEEHLSELCSESFRDDPYGVKRYEMECVS